MRLWRYLWAGPNTLVGLVGLVLAWLTGGAVGRRAGVLTAHGGAVGWWLRGGRWHTGGAACALGHVIFARDAVCLDRSFAHELHHVRQYEVWGPFTLPTYWLIGAWLACRGYHPYLDHPFEREA